MTVAALRLSQVAGSPDVRVGRPIGWLVRESRWPEFTERRVELRLTHRSIAVALTKAGHRTSRQLVQRWEREGWQPSESRIDALARVLRVGRQSVLQMFALDFGPEDRLRDHQAHRQPIANRGGN